MRGLPPLTGEWIKLALGALCAIGAAVLPAPPGIDSLIAFVGVLLAGHSTAIVSKGRAVRHSIRK
jgi:hypothetical protein